MNIVSTIKRTLRGEVSAGLAALEAVRRMNAGLERRRERRNLQQLNRQTARLTRPFASMSAPELLNHFRSRQSPKFFPGLTLQTARLQAEVFPEETNQLIHAAERVTNEHCWPLLGLGEKCFGDEDIDWHRDPLSGVDWPMDYHGDINLRRNDGSDARVVWELNRLGHLITLGRAYSITKNAETQPSGTVQID